MIAIYLHLLFSLLSGDRGTFYSGFLSPIYKYKSIRIMNMRNILITNLFVIFVSLSTSRAQTFSVTPTQDSTIVEVPFPLKAYTYNKFLITDTSLIVMAPAHKLDVIIADFKRDKRYYLNFTQKHIFAQDQTTSDMAYIGIDLIQSNDQYVLCLPDNVNWISHQSLGMQGDELHNQVFSDSIILEARTYHILKCIAHPGKYPISFLLKKDDRTIETKNVVLTFLDANISYSCTLVKIEDRNNYKEINYTIETSKPVFISKKVKVTLDIQINGKKEIVKDTVTLSPAELITNCVVSIPFSRYPRVFSVDSIFISNTQM